MSEGEVEVSAGFKKYKHIKTGRIVEAKIEGDCVYEKLTLEQKYKLFCWLDVFKETATFSITSQLRTRDIILRKVAQKEIFQII